MSRHDPALARTPQAAHAVAARPAEGWLAAYYAYEAPAPRERDARALEALEQMYAYYEG
jgi:hypothetical protein